MAEYSPEFLAHAQHQVEEEPDKTMEQIAADLGIGKRTLYRLCNLHGWRLRSDRPPRELPSRTRLALEAVALAEGKTSSKGKTSLKSKTPPTPNPSPPRASLAGGGEQSALAAGSEQPTLAEVTELGPAPDDNEQPLPGLSAIERLERLLEQELRDAEAERAKLGATPRSRVAADRNARTLAVLTQTARALDALRHGNPETERTDDDDMPRDIDAFRLELARRIDAFVASRTEPGDAEGSDRAAGIVDQVR